MPTSSAYPLPAPSVTVLRPGPGCAWLTTIPPRTVNLVRSLVDTAAGYTTASGAPVVTPATRDRLPTRCNSTAYLLGDGDPRRTVRMARSPIAGGNRCEAGRR